MKFIHTADVHLGSKMRAKFTEAQAKQRRIEIFNTFKKMVEYAEENGVRAILLSGDVFDEDNPISADKNDFYSVVKAYPNIDFLYLRGNHDVGVDYGVEQCDNLKTFGDEWTYYHYGDVVICGIESAGMKNGSTTLSLAPEKVNIIMLHGDVNGKGKDGIDIKSYANKNIDYMALGHIHKRFDGKIDAHGEYAYSGCLEGRSFDETGEKGFVLLSVANGKIDREFIAFATRTFEELDVDVSGATSPYQVADIIKSTVNFNRQNCYRINLLGDVEERAKTEDACERITETLKGACYLLSVKDKTQIKIDLDKYKNDPTIKGEFINVVLANEQLSESEKKEILSLGLKALEGKAI